MTDDGPITFRPKNAQSRAMLEAVAQHRGMSLSKLVAVTMDDVARNYIANVGPAKFAEDLKAAAEERERSLARQLEAMVAQAEPLAAKDRAPNTYPSAKPTTARR
jgi:hypothetical protein